MVNDPRVKVVLTPSVKPGSVASEVHAPEPMRYSYAVIALPPLSTDSLKVTFRLEAPGVTATMAGALGGAIGLPD